MGKANDSIKYNRSYPEFNGTDEGMIQHKERSGAKAAALIPTTTFVASATAAMLLLLLALARIALVRPALLTVTTNSAQVEVRTDLEGSEDAYPLVYLLVPYEPGQRDPVTPGGRLRLSEQEVEALGDPVLQGEIYTRVEQLLFQGLDNRFDYLLLFCSEDENGELVLRREALYIRMVRIGDPDSPNRPGPIPDDSTPKGPLAIAITPAPATPAPDPATPPQTATSSATATATSTATATPYDETTPYIPPTDDSTPTPTPTPVVPHDITIRNIGRGQGLVGTDPDHLSSGMVQAKRGDIVYVSDEPENLDDEHYVLQSWRIVSGDATRQGSWGFIMGNTNVELEFTFVRAYRVTVVNEMPEWGTATYQDKPQDFPEGMTVNIHCAPASGYRFVEATDGLGHYYTTADFSFDMPTEDLTILVAFEPIYWTLSVDNDFDFGEYSAKPEPQFGDDMYLDGTSVTITAHPNEEYALDYFVVNNGSPQSGSGNSITITMTQDTTVEIYYAEKPWYDVTTSVTPDVASIEIGGDWVEPTDFGAECLGGSQVTVSAPEIVNRDGVYYRFNHFTVGGTAQPAGQNSVTFTVNADTSVVAYYDQVYRLDISTDTAEAWGSVSPSYGEHFYAEGETVQITCAPNEHYYFVHATVFQDGSQHDETSLSFTMNIGHGNASIVVVWGEIPKYPVTVTINPEGGGSCSMTTGNYVAGSYTVTATAADGYEFESMIINDVVYGNPATFTLGGEGANIVINFVKKRYTLTINSSEHGYLSPDPTPNNGFYEHGQSITLVPYPEENYQQSSLTINGSPSSSNTFTITQNTTVSATFSRVYQIISDGVSGGAATIVSSPAGPLPSGSTFTVTVTADSDYVLDSVTVDGSTDTSCAGQSSFSGTYTMGDHDVHISATCHQVFHVYPYDGAQASPSSGPAGTTIYVTVPPDSHAMYAGAYIVNRADSSEFDITGETTDEDGTVHFSFTLPEGDVEIHIIWVV